MIVVAFLIGGLTQVSRQSQGYDATSNRALAAQGAVLADQSNATAAQVTKLLNDLSSQTRQGLQVGLDAAVEQTSDQSAQAALATDDTPLGSVATEFDTVFAERSQSMAQLRATVDDYLGMEPIPNAGAPPDTSAPTDAADAALRDPGHEPHRGGGCNVVESGPLVRLGAPLPRRRCRVTAGCRHRSGSPIPRCGGSARWPPRST